MDRIDSLAIANTVREPLLVLDHLLRVRFANLAFERHFGVSVASTAGRSLWAVGDGEWNHLELRQRLDEVLATRSRFDDFQLEHDFGPLGRRVLLLNASEMAMPDPAQRCILLAMEDVTERRRAEKELAERTGELERFAMVASHDLQEPLRKIRTYGAMLVEECAPSLGDEGREYVARMSGAAARMQTLIEDLLVLARASASTPRVERVALGPLVREVLTDLEVAIGEAGATVTVGELPDVTADQVQMRQLFQNLLSNALKFRRRDVPLRIQLDAAPAAGPPMTHAVVVRDNGIGFDERHAETIFGPFERLHGRHEYEGSGVGLAVCRRIVERHHGHIAARSVPGEGAAFTITFPSTSPLGPATPPAARPESPRQS